MLPTSVSRWAASVMMARLCARYPPAVAEQLAPPAPAAPCPHPHPHPAVTYHLPDHEDAADGAGNAQLPAGLEPAPARAGDWGAAAAVGSQSRGHRRCRGVLGACKQTEGGGHCQPHWFPVLLPSMPGDPGSHSLAQLPGAPAGRATGEHWAHGVAPPVPVPCDTGGVPQLSPGWPCCVPGRASPPPSPPPPATKPVAAVPAGCAPAPARWQVPLPHRGPRPGRRRGTGRLRGSRARGDRAPPSGRAATGPAAAAGGSAELPVGSG